MNTTTVLYKGAIIPFLCRCFLGSMLIFGLLSVSHAQTIFLSTDFGTPDSLIGWTLRNLGDSNPGGPGMVDSLWRYTPDGTASSGFYWDNRPAINSFSGGGAIVFDSDFLDNGGTGISCNPTGGFISCAPHEGVIESPPFDASNIGSITISFSQYLRAFDVETYVDISTDGFMSYDSIQVNQDLTTVPFGGETDPSSRVVLNISAFAGFQSNVQIRFRFKGEYYFWIVDDVIIEEAFFPEDVVLEEITWPNIPLICYLGEEERVQFQIRNQGQTPQSNFEVRYDYATTATASVDSVIENFTGTLLPNESVIYTFNTSVNLEELTIFSGKITVPGDLNGDNDIKDLGLTDTCKVCIDSIGGKYICNEILVQIYDSLSVPIKDSLRDEYSAERVQLCGCDTLEIWSIPDTIMHSSGAMLIGPEATTSFLKGMPRVEDAGLNYLMNIDPEDTTLNTIAFSPPETSTGGERITVGVLDTGLDFNHDAVQSRFWVNPIEATNLFATDLDSNCYSKDIWGGNMITPDELPSDSSLSGHGTHVAGTILNGAPACVNTEIMPIKVVARNGQGTLFDLICGMRYAQQEGAHMVNISLGYQGVLDSVLLREAKKLSAADILMFTSAGNDTSNNDDMPHWPSNLSTLVPHVIAVTSVDKLDSLSKFANYGKSTVNIATKGENLFGPVPGSTSPVGLKSGTSMASALVSRIASFYWSFQGISTSGLNVKNFLYNNAVDASTLDGLVENRRRLNEDELLYLGAPCIGSVSVQPERETFFTSFPNPFEQDVQLSFELEKSSLFEIRIVNQMGQVIHQDQVSYPAGLVKWTWKAPKLPQGMYVYQILLDGTPSHTGRWIRL